MNIKLALVAFAVFVFHTVTAQAEPKADETRAFILSESRAARDHLGPGSHGSKPSDRQFFFNEADGTFSDLWNDGWGEVIRLDDIKTLRLWRESAGNSTQACIVEGGELLILSLRCYTGLSPVDGDKCVAVSEQGKFKYMSLEISLHFCPDEVGERQRRRIANAFSHLITLQGGSVEISDADSIGSAFD